MASSTVYVSRGATEDEVSAAVAEYLSTLSRSVETVVEFGDEYPGFDIAIDVYGSDADAVTASARDLMAGIASKLPGRRLAINVDLEQEIMNARSAGEQP